MALRALPLSHQLELAAGGGARHPIARRLSRQDPLGWLVCFTSFTMLVLASWSASRPGQSLTTIVILLFLAPWGWIVLRQPGDALRSLIVNWVVLALPLLAVVSALWSDYPAVSLKGGVQYMVTTSIGMAGPMGALAGIVAFTCTRPATDYDPAAGSSAVEQR